MRLAPGQRRRLGVVGGGAAGIAAAYYAVAAGWEVEILEASAELGGRMGGAWLGSRRIDFGGKNLGRNYPLFRAFIREQGDFEYEPF